MRTIGLRRVTGGRRSPESPALLAALSEHLSRGGVLAIPTESSYGLAVDPRSAAGVDAIYRIKEREAGKPLPVVAADRGQVAALGVDPGLPELDLLERVWPAAVTAVLPLLSPGSLPAAAGEGTVAVRVPGHAGLRELLARLGLPLTATSANRSGEPPVLDPGRAAELLAGCLPEAVREEAEPLAVVVDGGTLPGGPPSTIVRIRGVHLEVLREGAVPAAEVAARLGLELGRR